MTVTQAVGCVPSGDTTKRSCGRVYEVNNGTNTLTASRTIAKAGTYFFYPAATFAGTSTVGMSIGRSSSTTFGSLYTTAGTWGGALAAPVRVQAGTATNTTKRYGDYFAAAPQPGTTNQFWVAGEIGGTSGTKFKYDESAVSLTWSPAAAGAPAPDGDLLPSRTIGASRLALACAGPWADTGGTTGRHDGARAARSGGPDGGGRWP